MRGTASLHPPIADDLIAFFVSQHSGGKLSLGRVTLGPALGSGGNPVLHVSGVVITDEGWAAVPHFHVGELVQPWPPV